MRRLAPLIAFVVGALLACAAPPTALPQTISAVVPWQHVFHGRAGDSAIVVGDFKYSIDVKDLLLVRQPAETVPRIVVDTLWCTPAGVCSETKPVPPTDVTPVVVGVPFGAYDLFTGWQRSGDPSIKGGVLYTRPDKLDSTLATMRATGTRAWLKLTGETHNGTPKDPDLKTAPLGTDAYRTAWKFDLAKWKAATAIYGTPAIKAKLAQAVADGLLLGYMGIDEPQHSSWGGVITKATIDEMARYSKSLFPTLPFGLGVSYYWRADETYKVVDYIIPQSWKPASGLTPQAWTAAAIDAARKNGVAAVLSFNLQGMACTVSPTCPTGERTATPAETRAWLRAFVDAPSDVICGVTLWRFDKALFADPAYRQVFGETAALLAKKVTRSCRRT